VALEGTWALRHAVVAQADVEAVFVCPELVRGPATGEVLERARAAGAATFAVSPRLLARMVAREGPDGVAAIAHLPDWALDDIVVGPSARLLVVDGIERPGNLGAIVRCADAAGVAGVILTAPRTRVSHPLTVKASMGSVFTVPVIPVPTHQAIAWVRGHGVTVVAADPAATRSYRVHRYQPPFAIVVGSERHGLTPPWRDAADALVAIPMLGTCDSLNVGHAAAIILFEATHVATSP
jgi:TrmH family RNA methyltransferase